MSENKTIIDLIKLVSWESVERSLKYNYPEDNNDYSDIFFRFKNKKPIEKNFDYCIVVNAINNTGWQDCQEWEFYYSFSSRKIKDDGLRYSVSFIPWHEVASYPIHEDTLKHYTYHDIIGFFLWEITFYGNETKMLKISKQLDKDYKNLKKEK